MKKCIIIAGGSLAHPEEFISLIKNAQLVICADSGATYMKQIDLLPDVIIGDLDSISPGDKRFFEEKPVRIIPYSPRKDATDTELAVSFAIEQQADDITLIGGSGTRLDHTMANMFLLKKLVDRQISCRIIDHHNEIFLITAPMDITGQPGELISIVPVTEKVTGVTLSGFEYPLDNATIHMGSTIGISNRLVAKTARISIKNGVVFVFKSKD